jgi:hypothetical protein
MYFITPRVQRCSELSEREFSGDGRERGAPRRVARPLQVAHPRAGQLAGDRAGSHWWGRGRHLPHLHAVQGVPQARRRRALLMFNQAHVARLQQFVCAAAMGVHVHPRVILFPPVPDDSLSQNDGRISAFFCLIYVLKKNPNVAFFHVKCVICVVLSLRSW